MIKRVLYCTLLASVFSAAISTFAATATFVTLDKTTQGNWKGVYGSDGYTIPYQGANLPGYVSPAFSGASQWVWNYDTTDAAALQKPSASTRIASCWYAASAYTVDLNFTDGQTHRLAAYFLDWDNMGRVQTVTVSDAASGAVLNTQTLSAFNKGAWAVWDLSGHVTLTVRASSGNAVAGGLFLGGAPAVVASPAPEPSPSPSPTPAPVQPAPSSSRAAFVALDQTTLGNWKGVYGGDGYNIPSAGGTFPSYSAVKFPGASQWVWNDTTADSAALLKPNSYDRIASCWYAPSSYNIDINITDGQSHRLAVYCLDWDAMGRVQSVTVSDAGSGAVLNSQNLSSFTRGVWLVWDVQGHIVITLRASSGNAVAGGVFFGSAAAVTQPAPVTPPAANTLPDLASLPNRVFPSPEGFSTVQYAPNGNLGYLAWRDQQLIFRERNTSGSWSEDLVDNAGNTFQMLTSFTYYGLREDYKFQPSAVLLYDSASRAHVFQTSGRNISHYTHGTGGWLLSETITDTLANDNLAVLVGAAGPNNVFHLAALSAGSPRNLTYASNKTGQWNWSTISTVTDAPLTYWAPPYAPRWLSLAVDSRNAAHLTFRTSMDLTYDSAGHPRAYSELKYASNLSGQWQISLVQKPDDISAEAANGASIAIGPDDQPRIASWYNDRGDGGSSAASRLFYHEPNGAGGWTHTVILSTPDGYSAGDGPKGTGFSPYLRFDSAGRPHILFLDHAGEHFGGIGQQEYAGNLRHGWRSGGTWYFESLYRQTDPLRQEIVYPAFAIFGREMAVTLLQRDTQWNLSSYPPLSNSTCTFRFFTKPVQ